MSIKIAYCKCHVKHIHFASSPLLNNDAEFIRLASEGHQVEELERQGSLKSCPELLAKIGVGI